MDHTFQPSLTDALKCARCKYGIIEHTELATCECCPNKGKMSIYNDMLMCDDCIKKEKDHQSPEAQEARLQAAREMYAKRDAEIKAQQDAARPGILNINNLVDKARAVDYTVQVRTDIFNAETVAIYEVFKSIDADEAIPANQKAFKKAEYLTEHQQHLQKVIFEANQSLLEAQNKLRVSQSELQKMVNQLRAEEREKLKIQHPDYKPGAVKPPKETVAKPRKSKVKFDKAALMDEAAKLQQEGFPVQWSMLQMMCTARDMTPAQAAAEVRKTMGGAN